MRNIWRCLLVDELVYDIFGELGWADEEKTRREQEEAYMERGVGGEDLFVLLRRRL